MSGKGGGGNNGGKGNMVQSLKEIVCTEQEIYATLEECNMTLDEAINRLLSQDPFHEVKSKREKKKENKDTSDSRLPASSDGSIRSSKGISDRSVGRGRSSLSSYPETQGGVSRSHASQPIFERRKRQRVLLEEEEESDAQEESSQIQGSLISALPTCSDFLPTATESFHDQNFLLDPLEVQAPALPHPSSPIPALSPTQAPDLSARVPPRTQGSPNPPVRNSVSEEQYHELRACIESIGTAIESFQSLYIARQDQFEAFLLSQIRQLEASTLSQYVHVTSAIHGLHDRIDQVEKEQSKAFDDVTSSIRFNTSHLADQMRRESDRVITHIGYLSTHLTRSDSEPTPVDEGLDEGGEDHEKVRPASPAVPSGDEPLAASLSDVGYVVAQVAIVCEDEPIIDPADGIAGSDDLVMTEPVDERESSAGVQMADVDDAGDTIDGERVPPVSPVTNVPAEEMADEPLFRCARDFYARMN